MEPWSVKTEAVHEAVAVEIKLRGSDNQLVMAVYRNPNRDLSGAVVHH